MENALVSVVVISYNSAKTIAETLESIRAQTYSPLELIVSDDASTDDTAAIAREWAEKNRSRFVRAEVIVAEKNGGIPANLNRGIAAARGEYLKSIAADDILCANCVNDNVVFMREHPESNVCISKIHEFSTNNGFSANIEDSPVSSSVMEFFSAPADKQYEMLLSSCFIDAPAAFFKTSLLKKFPYNELYPAMEDWPKWLELTKAGIRLDFLNKITVHYRVGCGVSAKSQHGFYKRPFMESSKLFYITMLRNALCEKGLRSRVAKYDRDFLLYDFIIALFDNKKNLFSSVARFFARLFLHIVIR